MARPQYWISLLDHTDHDFSVNTYKAMAKKNATTATVVLFSFPNVVMTLDVLETTWLLLIWESWHNWKLILDTSASLSVNLDVPHLEAQREQLYMIVVLNKYCFLFFHWPCTSLHRHHHHHHHRHRHHRHCARASSVVWKRPSSPAGG